MKRFLALTFALAALAFPASAMAGHGTGGGPQPLPDAACNPGTESARENAPTTADPHIPHDPGVDPPGCHHRNPTFDPIR